MLLPLYAGDGRHEEDRSFCQRNFLKQLGVFRLWLIQLRFVSRVVYRLLPGPGYSSTRHPLGENE